MADKLIPMDRAYREKHYPKGFFAAIAKKARGGGIIIIIGGIILALMGLGTFALIAAMIAGGDFKLSGDDIGGIIFMSIFGLILLIPGILFIRMGVRRRKMNETDWIKKFMEASDYPESIIRDFGNQAMEDESLQMQLGPSSIQGVLTRDYICICNLMAPCVFKIEDITGAYMVEMSNRININGKMKTIYSTNIAIFSNHKTRMAQEAKDKTVRQILEILTRKNPAIDTADGRLLPEKEYEKMSDEQSNQ